ncbi:MAG: phage major capsid protein [Eubacterium sp.]
MSYDNIKLEKGLYTTGKSFTQALEEIDPSENYKGTSLEGLDAFERQLKRFDIKISGAGSDPIAKFFKTTDSAALFPEYISRAVAIGAENNSKIEKIIATTTQIDSLDYRSLQTSLSGKELELMFTEEGESFTEIAIGVKENLTTLRKYGRMLVASYEAIRFQKLDLFTLTLKQIGAHMANSQFRDALLVIENSNVEKISATPEGIQYSDLVNLWNSFDAYNMTTLIACGADVANILNMPEFRDSNAGLDFHGTGRVITPLGAELLRCDNYNEGNLIGLDKTCALEKVEAMPVSVDFEKIIDRQFERAAISTIVGFSKILDGASKYLTTHE